MFRMLVDDLCIKLGDLDSQYQKAIAHINDISITAMGYLPSKYEIYKKQIKTGEKDPRNL